MAYNAGTNRKAKDADRYFRYRLGQDDVNSSMNLFDATIP